MPKHTLRKEKDKKMSEERKKLIGLLEAMLILMELGETSADRLEVSKKILETLKDKTIDDETALKNTDEIIQKFEGEKK